NDLLEIEKLESGQMKLNSDMVSIGTVIDRACESVRPYAETQHIDLVVEPSNASVYADAPRLIQVLVNLLGNAVKFSPPQSKIAISVLKSAQWIEIRVKDEGRGVPDSLKAAVFQRFKQVEAKDATEKKGSGLGLAICKIIVEQHGGSIGVDNNADKGS